MRQKKNLLKSKSFCLLWLVIISCSGPRTFGPRARYDVEVNPLLEREYQQAERTYQGENFQGAANLFQSFIDKHPYNRLTDRSFYRLGEIDLRKEQYETALKYFSRATLRSFDADLGPQAMYKEAVCQYRLKEYEKSKSTLKRIPLKYTNPKLRIRIGSLWIEVMNQQKNDHEKTWGYLNLVDAYQALPLEDRKVTGASWIVDEAVAADFAKRWIQEGEEEPAQLKKWVGEFNGRPVGGTILWKLIQTYNTKGDYAKARDEAGNFVTGYPKHEYYPLARMVLAEVEKRTGDTEIPVGVILPLSGKYSVAAESVLRGLECAAGLFEPCKATANVRLLIRDSGEGDPAKAVSQVQELVGEGVVSIIALLVKDETEPAIAEANRLLVPMVVLSSRKELKGLSPYGFRNFLTVSEQVETIVRYACETKKIANYAILYPETPIGKEFETVFSEKVAACQGKVVSRQSYRSDTDDFRNPLRNLKFSVASHTLGEPAYGFQALFIPDTYKNLLLIADAMKFLDVKIPLLLGSAGWDHPSLVEEKSEVLIGSVFTDGFFAKSSDKATREFNDHFQAAFAVEPTFLEAYSYDSLRLVQEVAKRHPSREAIQSSLASLKDFSGATGSISAAGSGEFKRSLFLLTVKEDGIGEIR
ncbi:MAG: ABC transporter substrate-binding protein [Deltaproteobacteria bacterium]|nr:ABC transporter substrate-binding protein [Deltaproteobacteria bacterium]